MTNHIDPTQDQGRALIMRGLKGPVVMLNLLRFRETADYSDFPQLAPKEPISGREAYQLYMAHTQPFLRDAGGSLQFLGEGGDLVIGPPDEHWHMVLLVRYPSVEGFLSFAMNEPYRAGLGHRTAALADSRLLPMIEGTP